MSKGKLLALSVVWLLIFGAGAVAWKVIVAPARQQQQQQAQQQEIDQTSSASKYRHSIHFGLDSFSGYAVLRNAALRDQLADSRIKWELVDDNADYGARLQALAEGKLQMAVFTIDALVKASVTHPDLPAVIVAVVDETRGADAMLGYKSVFNSPEDLNHPETRFVVTADSPSETLARVVMSNFKLTNLAADPLVRLKSVEEVYQRYQNSKPETRELFVVWEPFVSRILDNPQLKVVVDSGSFRGYIVDVLVASRDFAAKQPELVRTVLESYFRAAHQLRSNPLALVLEDARENTSPLTEQQAARLVAGIAWKNTQDNYAHFGLLDDHPGVQHLEDMIANITQVLIKTGAISKDPTDGKPNRLFYDRALAELQKGNFHPGVTSELVTDANAELPPLSDVDWQQLQPWGTLQVPPIVFARGTNRLTEQGEAELNALVETLHNWPRHYLLVRGNASRLGTDLEANRKLAMQRAEAVVKYLQDRGIAPARIRAVAGELQGEASVDFVLGQPAY